MAMSGAINPLEHGGRTPLSLLRRVVPVGLRTMIRQRIAPSSFPRAARTLEEVIGRIQPDLVHAMRIPYEGMIASLAMQLIDQGKFE